VSAKISQELAENGVTTRVFLPSHGKFAPLERTAVHPSLVEAAEWVDQCLRERANELEQGKTATEAVKSAEN